MSFTVFRNGIIQTLLHTIASHFHVVTMKGIHWCGTEGTLDASVLLLHVEFTEYSIHLPDLHAL